MRYEQIEINRLGSQGEVKRRIRCLAGHITVFRANDPQLLKLFANGLMGVTVPGERFSVLLDNTPFNADIHPRIGYGERFSPDDVMTVADYLVQAGVPTDGVDSLLLSHGLGGLSREACRNLSPEEDRMVRLLAIAFSDAGVVILNDPFALVPETWRNTFARDLSNFAWQKRAIVVVPALSDRPDDWIENEIVSRIQLEAPRKKTIGFGGAGADDIETQKMIAALRQEAAAGVSPLPERQSSRIAPEKDLLKGGGPGATEPNQRARWLQYLRIPRIPDFTAPVAILTSTFLIAVTATVAVLLLQRPPTPESFMTAAVKPPIAATPLVETKPQLILERYPEEISAAVTKAFTDPDALLGGLRSPPRDAQTASAAPQNNTPRAALPARPSLPAPRARIEADEEETTSAEDEAELARRREEIRQRFIEAIQRQSSQQE
jgi:hypothetical protein